MMGVAAHRLALLGGWALGLIVMVTVLLSVISPSLARTVRTYVRGSVSKSVIDVREVAPDVESIENLPSPLSSFEMLNETVLNMADTSASVALTTIT